MIPPPSDRRTIGAKSGEEVLEDHARSHLIYPLRRRPLAALAKKHFSFDRRQAFIP